MTKNDLNPLGSEPILPLLARFAIPSIISMLVSALYNMVDQFFIGRSVGMLGNAATNVAFPLTITCTALSLLCGIGASSNFGIRLGEGKKEEAAHFAGKAITMMILLGIALFLLARLTLTKMLMFFGATNEILEYARIYTGITSLGFPFLILTTGASSLIRADGSPRFSMFCTLVGAILNTILDPILIFGFDMGVAGAAWATVISQAVSGVLCLIYMIKKFTILRMQGDEWKPEKYSMHVLCGMGIPMGLQYSITAIGSVILQTAVNSLGSAAVAAVTAGGKISTFLCCPYDAMGATLATYAGQNIGARKLSRVGKGVRDCLILGAGYAVVALVIIYFFSDVITLLFVDAGETAIIANARTFLLINVAFYFPLSLIYVYRFTIQGLGYSRLAIFAGVSEMIARSLMGFCLVPVFGYLAVCFASPVAWLAADAFLLPAYIHVLKDLKTRLLRRSRMEETQAASAAGQPRA